MQGAGHILDFLDGLERIGHFFIKDGHFFAVQAFKVFQIDQLIDYLAQHAGRGPYLLLRAYGHLPQRVNILVLRDSKLAGNAAEFFLFRLTGQHLPADDGPHTLSVHNNVGGKVHKTRVAEIGALALRVAFLTSAGAFRIVAGIFHAKIRKIAAPRQILPLTVHRDGGHSGGFGKAVLNVLQHIQIHKAADIHTHPSSKAKTDLPSEFICPSTSGGWHSHFRQWPAVDWWRW